MWYKNGEHHRKDSDGEDNGGQPFNVQVEINIGIDMVNFIEKTDQLLNIMKELGFGI